jgi:hypothetical protein
MGSPHVFIACARQTSQRDYDRVVYVLEQIGGTYKIAWRSDRLYGMGPVAVGVSDVDGDGDRTVVFQDSSFGTGGGVRKLMLYSTRLARLFTVTESLNWQNLAGPTSPEVEIDSGNVPEMVGIIESVARERGFLRPGAVVDFDDADFAVQRWHKENGKTTSGQIKTHDYQGHPRYGASVAATFDTGTVLWLSFFKGPLFGYDRLTDKHFIAYSPAWFYNWAKCLAFDGERLWFGVHCRAGLMSFRPADNVLESYESFQGAPLPGVQKVVVENEVLILNGELIVPVGALLRNLSARIRHNVN